MSQFVIGSLVVAVVLAASAPAQAAEPEAAGSPAPTEGAASTKEAAATTITAGDTTKPAIDGARFRFGVSGGIGFFTAANEVGPGKVSCTYYGVDLRFGAQLNDMFGVYAQPTLGYYSTSDVGGLAAGGLLGMAVVVDVTLIDHFFA